jgi:hypothetical protein
MTDIEWARIAARMARMWPAQAEMLANSGVISEQYQAVREFAAQDIDGALTVYYGDGNAFAPNSGQLAKIAKQAHGVRDPTIVEALGLMEREASKVGGHGAPNFRRRDDDPAVSVLAEKLSGVIGWGSFCRMEDYDHQKGYLVNNYKYFAEQLVWQIRAGGLSLEPRAPALSRGGFKEFPSV